MKAKAQIFIGYARQDQGKVEDLYKKLSQSGFKPWMDVKDLVPGEKWESSIRKAIRQSDFFLACVSTHSANKRGFIQKEIREALDTWQERLDSDIFLIPVRLEDCEMPESLNEFHWVNLFDMDGRAKLLRAIRAGLSRRAVAAEPAAHVFSFSQSLLGCKEPLSDVQASTPEKSFPWMPIIKAFVQRNGNVTRALLDAETYTVLAKERDWFLDVIEPRKDLRHDGCNYTIDLLRFLTKAQEGLSELGPVASYLLETLKSYGSDTTG